MFKSKKITVSNAVFIENLFKDFVSFSFNEDKFPCEVCIGIQGQESYLVIRPGSFSGQISVEIISPDSRPIENLDQASEKELHV